MYNGAVKRRILLKMLLLLSLLLLYYTNFLLHIKYEIMLLYTAKENFFRLFENEKV